MLGGALALLMRGEKSYEEGFEAGLEAGIRTTLAAIEGTYGKDAQYTGPRPPELSAWIAEVRERMGGSSHG